MTLGSQTLTLTDASGIFAGAIGGNGGWSSRAPGSSSLSGTNSYTRRDHGRGRQSAGKRIGRKRGQRAIRRDAVRYRLGRRSGDRSIRRHPVGGPKPGDDDARRAEFECRVDIGFRTGFARRRRRPYQRSRQRHRQSDAWRHLVGQRAVGRLLPAVQLRNADAEQFRQRQRQQQRHGDRADQVANQVNLSIAAAGQRIQFWDGADQTGNGVVNGGAGTWNAANTNWTGAPGQANFNDQWRSSVGVFAGTAGTVTVAGAQAFDTLQFSTTGYVLNAGAGGQLQLAGLSGTGTINTDNGVVATINAAIVNGSSQSLTKVGGGTLILTAANTYSGGTTISGGTLQLGNGGTTGSIVGNVTDNGVLAINRSNAFTFAGVISGSGAFNQIGSGTTTLSGDNTYTGATTISAGGLTIAAGGSITSNVTNNATFNNFGTVAAIWQRRGQQQRRSPDGNQHQNLQQAGTVSGGLTNTAGITTNTGTINGGAKVSGGTLNTIGHDQWRPDQQRHRKCQRHHQRRNRQQCERDIQRPGALTSDGTFNNAAGATLAIGRRRPIRCRACSPTAASSRWPTAPVQSQPRAASPTMQAVPSRSRNGGTVKDDLNNAGCRNQQRRLSCQRREQYRHRLPTMRYLDRQRRFEFRHDQTTSLTWTGTVSNAGTFNNNAGATVSGLLTNTAGITVNNGCAERRRRRQRRHADRFGQRIGNLDRHRRHICAGKRHAGLVHDRDRQSRVPVRRAVSGAAQSRHVDVRQSHRHRFVERQRGRGVPRRQLRGEAIHHPDRGGRRQRHIRFVRYARHSHRLQGEPEL